MGIDIETKLKTLKNLEELLLDNKEKITSRGGGKDENNAVGAYILWSGSVTQLGDFASKVKEWLDLPYVTISKSKLTQIFYYLTDTSNIDLTEIMKDDLFLSANCNAIEELSEILSGINFKTIKSVASAYVLERVIEKDLNKANKWANNAKHYSDALNKLCKIKIVSIAGEKMLKILCDELVKLDSFSEIGDLSDWKEKIIDIDKSIANLPDEITEEQVINFLEKSKDSEKIKLLEKIVDYITKVRSYLSNVIWVKNENVHNKDYASLRTEFRRIVSLDNLYSVLIELGSFEKKVQEYTNSVEGKTKARLQMVDNVTKALNDESKIREFHELRGNLPLPESIFKDPVNFESKIKELTSLLRNSVEELTKKINNSDAVKIIKSPKKAIETIEPERLSEALSILIKEGIVSITAEGDMIKLQLVR